MMKSALFSVTRCLLFECRTVILVCADNYFLRRQLNKLIGGGLFPYFDV